MTDTFIDDLQAELDALILSYEGKKPARTPAQKKLSRGKLYEFYVLARVSSELRSRGFSLALCGQILDFKQSPGAIQAGDTYLRVKCPGSASDFRIYTDIEVRTIGSEAATKSDLSHLHEIDILAVRDGVVGNPHRTDLLLAVECKSTATFKKAIIKESLGVKREISFFTGKQRRTMLAQAAGHNNPKVASDPPFEFWLVYSDPQGDKYQASPKCFGMDLLCWAP